jgi:cytosine/adenosine deaminase-related metal-dependent hydrolase
MPHRTAIHAGHVVAFDGRGHRLLRDGTVIVDGDRIVFVGRRAGAPAEEVSETIDAPEAVLTPGLISTHAHIGGSPLDRSFIEDRGNPQFFYSGLFELLPVRGAAQDEDATRACVDFSMAELLRGGVTTVMEIGGTRGSTVAWSSTEGAYSRPTRRRSSRRSRPGASACGRACIGSTGRARRRRALAPDVPGVGVVCSEGLLTDGLRPSGPLRYLPRRGCAGEARARQATTPTRS